MEVTKDQQLAKFTHTQSQSILNRSFGFQNNPEDITVGVAAKSLLSTMATVHIIKIITYPYNSVRMLSVIKQNQQVLSMLKQKRSVIPPKGKSTFSRTIQIIRQLYQAGGIPNFYKGFSMTLPPDMPPQALIFMGRQLGQRYILNHQLHNRSSPYLQIFSNNAAVAAVSGLISAVIFTPVDNIRIKLWNQLLLLHPKPIDPIIPKHSFLKEAIKIISQQGIMPLYKGFITKGRRVMIYRGVQFGVYDTYKFLQLENQKNMFFRNLLAGWTSSVLALIVRSPLDNIRYQLLMIFPKNKDNKVKLLSLEPQIFKQKGFSILPKDINLTAIPRSFSPGLMLALYDKISHYLLIEKKLEEMDRNVVGV